MPPTWQPPASGRDALQVMTATVQVAPHPFSKAVCDRPHRQAGLLCPATTGIQAPVKGIAR